VAKAPDAPSPFASASTATLTNVSLALRTLRVRPGRSHGYEFTPQNRPATLRPRRDSHEPADRFGRVSSYSVYPESNREDPMPKRLREEMEYCHADGQAGGGRDVDQFRSRADQDGLRISFTPTSQITHAARRGG
jgi:hypothetical protein